MTAQTQTHRHSELKTHSKPQLRTQSAPDHVAWGDSPDALADIAQDAINLAVWARPEQPAVSAAVNALLAARPSFRFQESGTPDALHRALTEQLSGLGTVEALTEDIHLLADMMSCLFDHEHIGVRLSGLDKAMCPRYHVDRVHCRLIATYRGPGMMWLPNHAVARGQRATAPITLPPEQQLPHQHMPPHAVALCKGDGWPGNAGRGLIHRSPQPAAEQPRLLLTLDLC